MNTISKKGMLAQLYSVGADEFADANTGKKNRLIILTAAGIISGFLVKKSELDTKDPAQLVMFSLLDVEESILENFQSEVSPEVMSENKTDLLDSFMLTEVEIISTSGTKSTMPFLKVFSDQIIGLAIGVTT